MSVKLGLMGFGIFGIGVGTVVWWIAKIVSCIMIAGYISTNIFGLSGLYWWFASIIVYSILCKIVFLNNSTESYSTIVEKYKEKVESEKDEIDYDWEQWNNDGK